MYMDRNKSIVHLEAVAFEWSDTSTFSTKWLELLDVQAAEISVLLIPWLGSGSLDIVDVSTQFTILHESADIAAESHILVCYSNSEEIVFTWLLVWLEPEEVDTTSECISRISESANKSYTSICFSDSEVTVLSRLVAEPDVLFTTSKCISWVADESHMISVCFPESGVFVFSWLVAWLEPEGLDIMPQYLSCISGKVRLSLCSVSMCFISSFGSLHLYLHTWQYRNWNTDMIKG